MTQDPDISVRDLGEKIGVGKDTAARLKREWQEKHPAAAPEQPKESFIGGIVSKVAGSGLTLSKAEIEQYDDVLPTALEDSFDAVDKYLVNRQRLAGTEDLTEEIWSNLSEKELQTLKKFMLETGQHNPAMATLVRGTVKANMYVAVATIVLPRLQVTATIVKDTYKPPKRRKGRAVDANRD